jgi:hypothetical protein
MSYIASLLKAGKFSKLEARAAAGTTDLTSDVLDMAGFDSVLFIASSGDATSGTVIEMQVFGNTANSGSGGTEVTDGTAAQTSTTGTDADNKLLIADIVRWNPAYRYAYGVFAIDTQNCEADGIYSIQYNARDLPVTQPASVGASGVVVAG